MEYKLHRVSCLPCKHVLLVLDPTSLSTCSFFIFLEFQISPIPLRTCNLLHYNSEKTKVVLSECCCLISVCTSRYCWFTSFSFLIWLSRRIILNNQVSPSPGQNFILSTNFSAFAFNCMSSSFSLKFLI